MNYSTYGYHCSKNVTKPRNSNCNIKGIELEISDYDAGDILDELIEQNILTVPFNENTKKEHNIAIEEDGSVYKELVFKASSNRKILEGVKILEEHLNRYICNGHGTSCHIHLNKRYLREKRNLTTTDIGKAVEFIYPLLFKVSGRDTSNARRWANSIFADELDITSINLFKRAEYVDDIREDWFDDRYYCVNNNWKTIEIRIFSNYYNFNYDYIKLYLELCDLIVDMADAMKHKLYSEECDIAINLLREFFNKRNNKKFIEKHNLENFFLNEQDSRKLVLIEKLTNFKDELQYLYDVKQQINKEEFFVRYFRILRRIQRTTRINIRFELNENSIEELNEKIIQDIEERIESL